MFALGVDFCLGTALLVALVSIPRIQRELNKSGRDREFKERYKIKAVMIYAAWTSVFIMSLVFVII
jgi:hypothetical protein